MYGNYLQEYDNVNTRCDSKVLYRPRPQDYLDLVVRARTSIEPSAYGQNKGVGFEIDVREIPRKIYAGTVVNIVIEYEPDRNFHLYQAHNVRRFESGEDIIDFTYHQSRHMGPDTANTVGWPRYPLLTLNDEFRAQGENFDGEATPGEYDVPWGSADDSVYHGAHNETQTHQMLKGSSDGTDRWVSNNYSGANFLEKYGYRYFGWNFGVGAEGTEEGADWLQGEFSNGHIRNPQWEDDTLIGSNYTQGAFHARYGTSAGNPLILQGGKLQFRVKFTVVEDELWNGNDMVAATIVEALAGANGEAPGVQATEFIEATGLQPGEVGTGIFSFQSKIQIDIENDVEKVVRHEYDLGLNYEGGGLDDLQSSNFSFPTIRDGDTFSNLIVGVANDELSDNDLDLTRDRAVRLEDMQKGIPAGAFIINKASVDFYIETIEDDDIPDYEGYGGFRRKVRLAISKIDVEEEDVLTCVRRTDPNSPWFVLNNASVDAMQNFLTNGSGTNGAPNPFYDNVPNSVANKFYIPYGTFGTYENGLPSWATNWRTAFKPHFDVNDLNSAAGISGSPGTVRAMRNCFGRLKFNTGPHGGLYKSHAHIFNTPEEIVEGHQDMYKPVLGASRFRFSLMDGEGGPGAHAAGGNSAYDKYDVGKYGSLAARIDFNYKVSQVTAARYKWSTSGSSVDGYSYHAFMGGTEGGFTGTDDLSYSYGVYGATGSWSTINHYGLTTDADMVIRLRRPSMVQL